MMQASAFQLNIVNNRFETEVAYLNVLLAGGAGGISGFFVKKIVSIKRRRKEESMKLDKRQTVPAPFIIGHNRMIDSFTILRGIIAGVVAVSAGSSDYKFWASPIVGMSGGIIYGLSTAVIQRFRIDDPLETFSTHAMPGLLSLLLPIFFH